MNSQASLNAPFGARCFLTSTPISSRSITRCGLNAPFGAWCFLTLHERLRLSGAVLVVLMHLLALGAF